MSNFKTGAWSGERENATRREYNRRWPRRNPGYHSRYNREYRKMVRHR